ncbi:NAD(+) diphosphatase [Arenibacterium halophilum]|uniref:NAD(+) diphosphatase n=1 Tax=Arenibacterium halophilum TaxID=2583821 RepID=A0ABY2X917_9RHOB|nr:NAD(+) diphosphatase [Arenibacterium halophilum]TMV11788.1 NAD(+) diphosphatase [Arenibacterium halophilum]
MRNAEQVTFGGSGLDRAAHIRGDEAGMTAALAHDKAACVLMWRGKVLMAEGALAMVPMSHPVLGQGLSRQIDAPVFLGVEASGAPNFACDISGWTPQGLDLSELGQFRDTSFQEHPDFPPGYGFAEIRAVMADLSPHDAELAATAKAIVNWHGSHGFCAACGQPSKITQAGWQRTCPACNTSHFPRTDPVVIMLITHGNSVLMGRNENWPEGMFSLLAGFVEPGETIEAAVRREVVEESGVRVGPVSYLASQPWPFPASLMIGCRGEATSTEITVDPTELQEALWVTREDMMDVFAGSHPKIRPARKGAIAHFLLHNWLADTLD